MQKRPVRSRSTAAVLVATLVAAAFQLMSPAAVADTVPAVANDPANPETVAAKPLPTAQIDGVAWSQAVIGNTVYVAGSFTNARPAGSAPGVNTVPRSNLLAYDITTGNLVDSWAPSTNAEVVSIVASPDGSRLYVGGSFTSISNTIGTTTTTTTRNRMAALNPSTGAVITTFNPNPDAKVSAIAATNSTVYFGGSFGNVGPFATRKPRSRLAAYSAGAQLNWAPAAAGGVVKALTVTPDGSKVIAGGQFTTMNGSGNPGYGWRRSTPPPAPTFPGPRPE